MIQYETFEELKSHLQELEKKDDENISVLFFGRALAHESLSGVHGASLFTERTV